MNILMMSWRNRYAAFAVSLLSTIFLVACSSTKSSTLAEPLSSQASPIAQSFIDIGIPAGGEPIITASPEINFTLQQGDNKGVVGNARTVVIEHPLFDKAIEISVDKPNGQFWNGQVNFPINKSLDRGDKLLLHVYFRMLESSDETGTGFVSAFVESPAPDYTKYLMYQLVSSGEWEEYFLPMIIGEDFDRNEIFLKFGFGNGNKAQKIQLANITLLNYENRIDIEDLPITKPTYIGRGQDEAWRAEASARIEEHRKGDFSIIVEDMDAKPLPNAKISVKFIKHQYHFGSVAAARHLVLNDANSQMYRSKLLENFNQSGLENNLKWASWAGESGDNFSQSKAIAALTWLNNNHLYTRGHVMVWPSKRNMPDFLQNLLPENNPQAADPQVLTKVSEHISDLSNKTQGLIDEWDVLNEPFDNHYLMDAFGKEVMLDWFEQAKNENPNALLYINDYSIVSGGGTNTGHQDHYFNTIEYLVNNNAPIHGIGIQGHFSTTPTPITRVYDIINRYHLAFPNLAIRATEFDIDTFDEQMQADYTRDFLTIFFSHPATVGVQKWGFWAGAHWRPNAAMYHQDWTPKPNQRAWYQTVYGTFWNDFSGQTDEKGEFSERGFYGNYAVTVEVNGEEKSFLMKLRADESSNFTVRVE